MFASTPLVDEVFHRTRDADLVDRLERAIDEGELEDLDDLAAALTLTWHRTWPVQERPWDVIWAALRRRAGYCVNGRRDERARPPEALLLWRGGPAGSALREGNSWTSSERQAGVFELAARWHGWRSTMTVSRRFEPHELVAEIAWPHLEFIVDTGATP